MTERLATLLHEEADGLTVPAPDTGEILGMGRRMRTRRRVTQVGSTAAVLVIALAVAATAIDGDRGFRSDLPPASARQLEGWAVASGSTVQLGNGHTVHVGGTVKSVYYTSAGVLVRYGAKAETDAPDSTYALIDERGHQAAWGLELGDRVPATDPTQPYLVYADATDDPRVWNVVVLDVRSGQVTREIPVHGAFTWGGWVAPPVALSGQHVYVAMDAATVDVDLADGSATRSKAMRASYFPDVAGGRAIQVDDRANDTWVVDAQTGKVLERQSQNDGWLSLSPDGRHAVSASSRVCEDDGRCTFVKPVGTVFNLDTGTQIHIDLGSASYGWTPQGDLLRVTTQEVAVCDPDTNTCRSTPIEVEGRNLRLGGNSYES